MSVRKPSSVAELKRKQTTAVVLLGVIGAEFGQDIAGDAPTSPAGSNSGSNTLASGPPANTKRRASQDTRRKSSVVEGFGLNNNNLARLTSEFPSHLACSPT